jgi:hypothetical protein
MWGSRISGWVLALIGLVSLFATAGVTSQLKADPTFLNKILYGTAGVSLLSCAWLWVRAHYDVWIGTESELQALRQKHNDPRVTLDYDHGKDTFVLANDGGDAFKIRLFFGWSECKIHLSDGPLPQLPAGETKEVRLDICSLQFDKTTEITSLWSTTYGLNQRRQLCEVGFVRDRSQRSNPETIMIWFEDNHSEPYETECKMEYYPDTGNTTFTAVRTQRTKPIVPLPYRVGGSYDL